MTAFALSGCIASFRPPPAPPAEPPPAPAAPADLEPAPAEEPPAPLPEPPPDPSAPAPPSAPASPPSEPPAQAPLSPPSPRQLALRQTILEAALGQIGRPYLYGGGDGDGFDCSGLVKHVYAEVGVALPRTAAQQANAGRFIKLRDALPGDLVFFRTGYGTHVGIYVGNGRMVHAPAKGKHVTVTSIKTPYWRTRLKGAVRVLR